MAADPSQLESAFMKADAAGDTESASVLAAEIKRLRAAQPEAIESPTSFKNLAGAAIEPSMALGSEMISAPIAGLAGIAGSLLPGPQGQGADWTRKVSEQGTYQPRSQGGQNALSVLGYLPQKLGELSRYAGGGVTDVTGSPMAGAATETLLQAAPMALGAAAMPKMPGIVQKPLNYAQNLFGSTEGRAGRLASDVAGSNQDAVIAALRAHQNQVPGSAATAGQAALPAGSAEFSALQEVVANRNPSKYGSAGIEGAQEGARLGALEGIAKTPADMAAAIRNRANATTPIRETNLTSANILQGGVKSSDVLSGLDAQLNTPGVRASDIVQKTIGAVKDKIKTLSDANGTINARDLYTIRKELGNTISTFSKETANWDKRMASGLQKDVQGYIDTAIENAGGSTWRDYLSRYADMSKPINRMETGQALAEGLRNSIGSSERPVVFGNVVKKAADQESFATGKPRMADLTSKEQGLVEAIRQELGRDATHAKMAREGSQEAMRRLNVELPQVGSIGIFSPKLSFTRGMYNRLVGGMTEGTLKKLSEKMDNPQEIARIMAAEQARKRLSDQLLKQTYSGAVVPQMQGQQP